MTGKKAPSLFHALIPIMVLIAFLAINVFVFKDGAIGGPNQMALIVASCIAGIIAWKLGYNWTEINNSILRSIDSAMTAMIILLAIGAVIGTWMLSGIVPAMIYYGLKVLNPTIFLFAACVISAVISLATGSSWTTIATVGVALLGIGKALEINEGVIAGAIISGAYFGDKMSPLSDTTNLAPAMAGTDLFTHVRYMVFTTGPSLIITLIIFLVWGFTLDTSRLVEDSNNTISAIQEIFNINPFLFIVPAIVVVLIVRKVPATPALLIGAFLGGIFAVIFQHDLLVQIWQADHISPGETTAPQTSYMESSFYTVLKSLTTETIVPTSNTDIQDLLSARGMAGMLNTIWLIMCAMTFGGAMESCGLLKVIADQIIKFAHSTGSLVLSTTATCIFFNITASDQYMAIAVPGRMYAETFKKRGLKPEVLSRTLEDSGTVTSVLIPWNTCGAAQSGALHIATLTYAPYCFFNIISPFMTVFFAYMNIKIRRINDTSENNN